MNDWKREDRVLVELPDHWGVAGPRGRMHWFPGTVAEVDPPGRVPGVRVILDVLVNGVDNCYATHGELRREAEGLP